MILWTAVQNFLPSDVVRGPNFTLFLHDASDNVLFLLYLRQLLGHRAFIQLLQVH